MKQKIIPVTPGGKEGQSVLAALGDIKIDKWLIKKAAETGFTLFLATLYAACQSGNIPAVISIINGQDGKCPDGSIWTDSGCTTKPSKIPAAGEPGPLAVSIEQTKQAAKLTPGFNPETVTTAKPTDVLTATPAPTATQRIEPTAQLTPKEAILKLLSTEKPVFKQTVSFDKSPKDTNGLGLGVLFEDSNPQDPGQRFYVRVGEIYKIGSDVYAVAYVGPNDKLIIKANVLRYYNGFNSPEVSVDDLSRLSINQDSTGSVFLPQSNKDYIGKREAGFALGRAINNGEILYGSVRLGSGVLK